MALRQAPRAALWSIALTGVMAGSRCEIQ